jgi:hypothetical protein
MALAGTYLLTYNLASLSGYESAAATWLGREARASRLEFWVRHAAMGESTQTETA